MISGNTILTARSDAQFPMPPPDLTRFNINHKVKSTGFQPVSFS
jgi:hypothetical protein